MTRLTSTTFLAVSILAAQVGFGQDADEQQRAATAINKQLNGYAESDDGFIVYVSFGADGAKNITNDDLKVLRNLNELEFLSLRGCSQVTDIGLENIQGLKNVEWLVLIRTGTNDEGLKHLSKMHKLKVLDLSNTDVSDKGLQHLKYLENLTSLSLDNTNVEGSGLAHLAKLAKLRQLYFPGTEVNDKGLVCIATMTQLEELSLSRTLITDEGVKATDHLKALTNLKMLYLEGTSLSEPTILRIKQELPKCEIKP